MSRLSAPDRLSDAVSFPGSTAPLTTWGVGGAPKCLVTPGMADIAEALCWLIGEGVAFEVLGGGSNVLIADGELPVALLATGGLDMMEVSLYGEKIAITCGAGVKLRSLAALCAKSGWSGLEFVSGIPGSVGGAAAGNSGTRRGAINEAVTRIQTAGPDGLRVWEANEIAWGYRSCSLAGRPNTLITSVTLELAVSTADAVRARVREVAAERAAQPLGKNTAGCVFKNPPGDSAGRLLDMSGCKELSIGGARVSPKHANFIESAAGATADDILSLSLLCRRRVHEVFGIKLAYEVKFIGIDEHLIV